jgi:hypothetical protein
MRIRILHSLALLLLTSFARARAPGDPIRLVWQEGDVGGMSTVYDPDGREAIGTVEYHQTRHGDRLSATRITRFRDGSSDEDSAVARIGDTLDALEGRSVIRDPDGEAVVDLRIDVAGGRIAGSWGAGDRRQSVDERTLLPAGTYWGPLIFMVLRNFGANAEDDRLVFRTVAPTPRPIVIDMELTREAPETIERTGLRYGTETFRLSPTIHWLVDPVVRLFAPRAIFWMVPGDPPALARYAGPRNYARQEIVIQ